MQGSSTAKEVTLSGSLTVDKALGMKDALAQALASSSLVLIDLSDAEDIDLACLQLLYAASADAQRKGKRIGFGGTIPSRIARRLAACGFLRGLPERGAEFEAALVGFHRPGA